MNTNIFRSFKALVLPLLLTGVMICFSPDARAQLPTLGGNGDAARQEPVTWAVSVKMKNAHSGVLTVKAKVNAGWHFYGLTVPKGGPKATVINLDSSRGVKFTGPLKPSRAAVSEKDAMFGIDLTYWGADVSFTREFKIERNHNGRPVIEAAITYMACDNVTCTPPRTVTKTVAVPVNK